MKLTRLRKLAEFGADGLELFALRPLATTNTRSVDGCSAKASFSVSACATPRRYSCDAAADVAGDVVRGDEPEKNDRRIRKQLSAVVQDEPQARIWSSR